MKLVRKIHVINNYKKLLGSPKKIAGIRDKILEGDLFIFQNVFPVEFISKLRSYLSNIGSNSFPNYDEIKLNAKNSHRINIWDERSYIKGCFHQFSFYPWNQDIFNLFKHTREIYQIRNEINNIKKDKYLDWKDGDDCVSRLSFQFYPKGIGGLNLHSDPIDKHQLCVPSLVMSKKGKDFKTGGLCVLGENKEKLNIDDLVEIGDVIFFNAQVPHGVDIIDKNVREDWPSFEGRWIMLFAVNKVSHNSEIADSLELKDLNGE